MRTKHLSFIIIALMFTACQEVAKDKPKAERIIPVGTMSIDSVSGIVSHTYVGTLEEGQSIDLSFKYGGTLESLAVKEGTQVRKGQMIARVSSPSLENTLRSSQATLEQAKDAYDRLKKVYDNGSLPEIKWKEMVANLEKAQAAYDLALSMTNENNLYAPFGGTVTDLDVEIGQNISPLIPIARLINTDGLAVRIAVPENEIANIHLGDLATVTIPALGDTVIEGSVTEKSMTASLMAHSYPAKVSLANCIKGLAPGMIGKVAMKADISNGIVIPANAVLINNEGKFVWIVKDGCATRRQITITGYSGKGVVVGSGLGIGDHVITEGYQKISEGMKVSEYEKD